MERNIMKEFEKCLLNAGKLNLESFEFEGKTYNVNVSEVCVQTLIDNRILYRIYRDEEKNEDTINYNSISAFLF